MQKSMFVARTIEVRALFGERFVPALCFNEWAVHRQIENPSLWCITWLVHGLSLPFAWASFRNSKSAMAAALDIARMRNDWIAVSQPDMNARMKVHLQAICSRHGAVDGGLQPAQRIDGPRPLGKQMHASINGYSGERQWAA